MRTKSKSCWKSLGEHRKHWFSHHLSGRPPHHVSIQVERRSKEREMITVSGKLSGKTQQILRSTANATHDWPYHHCHLLHHPHVFTKSLTQEQDFSFLLHFFIAGALHLFYCFGKIMQHVSGEDNTGG